MDIYNPFTDKITKLQIGSAILPNPNKEKLLRLLEDNERRGLMQITQLLERRLKLRNSNYTLKEIKNYINKARKLLLLKDYELVPFKDEEEREKTLFFIQEMYEIVKEVK